MRITNPENRHKILYELVLGNRDTRNLAIKFYEEEYLIKKLLKKINALKYPPKIIDGKLVCTKCNREKELVFHHDHDTGEYLALVCNGCNLAIGNNEIIYEKELQKERTSKEIVISELVFDRIKKFQKSFDIKLGYSNLINILLNNYFGIEELRLKIDQLCKEIKKIKKLNRIEKLNNEIESISFRLDLLNGYKNRIIQEREEQIEQIRKEIEFLTTKKLDATKEVIIKELINKTNETKEIK